MEQATLKTDSGGLGITLKKKKEEVNFNKIPIKNNGDFYYCLLRDLLISNHFWRTTMDK